jgi:hypothetical protein
MKLIYLFTVMLSYLNGCSTIFFPWKNTKKNNKEKWEWAVVDGNCKYRNVKVAQRVLYKIIMDRNLTLKTL